MNKAYDTEVCGRLARPLETVETYLSKHTFLVGERLSLADISAATVLRTAYSFILGKAERAKYPHTFRFYETVIHQPKIRDILSGGQLVEIAQQFVPPAEAPSKEKPKAGTSRPKTRRRSTSLQRRQKRRTNSMTCQTAASTSKTGSAPILTAILGELVAPWSGSTRSTSC